MDDDLASTYRMETELSMRQEAERRMIESENSEADEKLKNTPLHQLSDLEPGLIARLGPVKTALNEHGGSIKVISKENLEHGLKLVLDLTGACLSCSAAPGTLQGVKSDLEADPEIARILFSKNLLDSFDNLSQEFILSQSNVEFV